VTTADRRLILDREPSRARPKEGVEIAELVDVDLGAAPQEALNALDLYG
jgi:hypothetical protein